MINNSTLKFLKDVKLNSAVAWLADNRKSYEDAKNNIVTSHLILSISDLDKTISNAYLAPQKRITGLNRDLRFAKDKTPYKTDYYIVLNKSGKNSPSVFYYPHIEPDNCFDGGGVYNPQPDQLKKIRQEIDYTFNAWTTILKDKTCKKTFPRGINNSGVLTKTPKAFDESKKASAFLSMKGFYTMERRTAKELISIDTLGEINFYLKTTKPLVGFLNRAIEND